jgi:hypothetical protein
MGCRYIAERSNSTTVKLMHSLPPDGAWPGCLVFKVAKHSLAHEIEVRRPKCSPSRAGMGDDPLHAEPRYWL